MLGWSELHRFMAVNEQPAAMPTMTFDATEISVVAWTGGQYVGRAFPELPLPIWRLHGKSQRAAGVGTIRFSWAATRYVFVRHC